jgi:hypothetical protein
MPMDLQVVLGYHQKGQADGFGLQDSLPLGDILGRPHPGNRQGRLIIRFPGGEADILSGRLVVIVPGPSGREFPRTVRRINRPQTRPVFAFFITAPKPFPDSESRTREKFQSTVPLFWKRNRNTSFFTGNPPKSVSPLLVRFGVFSGENVRDRVERSCRRESVQAIVCVIFTYVFGG